MKNFFKNLKVPALFAVALFVPLLMGTMMHDLEELGRKVKDPANPELLEQALKAANADWNDYEAWHATLRRGREV